MNQSFNEDIFNEQEQSNTLKDYLILIRNHLVPVILITAAGLIAAIFYAAAATDIYKTGTSLKVAKPGGSILQSPLMPEISDFGNDRFIANEIEILNSYRLRERVARALIDTFVTLDNPDNFEIIYKNEFGAGEKDLRSIPEIAGALRGAVAIEQKRGLDIIEIFAESPSPYEAALIANIYTIEYKRYNLEISRDQLTFIKNFLEKQREEKKQQLNDAEDILRSYQERGGIIALDQQAQTLIQQLSQFEAQKNAAQIEIMASDEILSQYKEELKRQDPRLAEYLESATSEAYITALQNQIAELQLNKDLALTQSDPDIDITAKVKEYDLKIRELRGKLEEKIKVMKAGILAGSPESIRTLSQKIIDEEVKNIASKIKLRGLNTIVERYDQRFNKLPKTSLELARFQRNRESLEKLYVIVEEKYQEALINEQSQPGNVLIVDDARIPTSPSKPNRMLIVLVGFVLGAGLAFGFVFVKNYFDDTIQTPEDVQKNHLNVLAWIPQIDGLQLNGKNGSREHEFVVALRPDSIPGEAFRALRTRVQFSRPDKASLKTVLVTSPAPQEGKTTIAINLAGSFAQSNKKTLIVDCDLRKPRLHNIIQRNKRPGLVDYLFGEAKFDEIVYPTQMKHLSMITSGTIPPNPAEMLDSQLMDDFLAKIRAEYDFIVLDSPPVIAVTDAELLSRKADGTLLVVSAEVTEKKMISRAVELLKHDNSRLIGGVLNNFSMKAGYGSYYKYYYYYSTPETGK